MAFRHRRPFLFRHSALDRHQQPGGGIVQGRLLPEHPRHAGPLKLLQQHRLVGILAGEAIRVVDQVRRSSTPPFAIEPNMRNVRWCGPYRGLHPWATEHGVHGDRLWNGAAPLVRAAAVGQPAGRPSSASGSGPPRVTAQRPA